MRTRAVGGLATDSAAQAFLQAYCFSTDSVGDVVYIMGPMVGDFYQVTQVDHTDPSKMPGVGIIRSKDAATQCVVQTRGIVVGLYTGLTPGRRLLVQDDGRPGHGFTRATTGVKLLQGLGVALSSTDIFLSIETPTITLPT